jgi:hypothetical protein
MRETQRQRQREPHDCGQHAGLAAEQPLGQEVRQQTDRHAFGERNQSVEEHDLLELADATLRIDELARVSVAVADIPVTATRDHRLRGERGERGEQHRDGRMLGRDPQLVARQSSDAGSEVVGLVVRRRIAPRLHKPEGDELRAQHDQDPACRSRRDRPTSFVRRGWRGPGHGREAIEEPTRR